MLIPIDKITVEGNRRPIDDLKVVELAGSIRQIGLINPITVRVDKGNVYNYFLVAGLHRLEAYKLLEISEIEAKLINKSDLETELIEIDENFVRNELHYTERAELLQRKKEIYEELNPHTKKGAVNQYTKDIKAPKIDCDGSKESLSVIITDSKPSFVEDTAAKTGMSKSTIEKELQIANKVIPEAKQILQEQNIPKTEAVKLAREEPEIQKKIVPLFESGQTKKVEEAKKIIDPIDEEYDRRAAEIEARSKRVKKVMKLIDYTQFLGITEQSVLEYIETFPKNHGDFVKDLNRLKPIIDETIEIYNRLNQIRRVK